MAMLRKRGYRSYASGGGGGDDDGLNSTTPSSKLTSSTSSRCCSGNKTVLKRCSFAFVLLCTATIAYSLGILTVMVFDTNVRSCEIQRFECEHSLNVLKDKFHKYQQQQHDRSSNCNNNADQYIESKIRSNMEHYCSTVLNSKLQGTAADNQPFPSQSMGSFVVGIGRVSKQNFTDFVDIGVPLDKPKSPGGTDVMIVYNNRKALPNDFGSPGFVPDLHSAETALENCDYVNIVLTDQGNRKQCIAIVPQYESFHIQRFMRTSEQADRNAGLSNYHGMKLDGSSMLQQVSRGLKKDGFEEFFVPSLERDTKQYWGMLQNYLTHVETILDELRPILEKIAVHNTVIVMVCNYGQVELLINFVCAAKARNLDTSSIIVFTTDEETTGIVQGLGIAAYYDYRVRCLSCLYCLYRCCTS